MRKVAYENEKAEDRRIERESALGIAFAIRSWQEENIEEVRLEVERNKKELEEIRIKRKIWVAKKMKEIDERNEQKKILLEERAKYLEEKKRRIEAKKAILAEKKKLKDQKPKRVRPVIFSPKEQEEYEVKKAKYFQEYLEYEE